MVTMEYNRSSLIVYLMMFTKVIVYGQQSANVRDSTLNTNQSSAEARYHHGYDWYENYYEEPPLPFVPLPLPPPPLPLEILNGPINYPCICVPYNLCQDGSLESYGAGELNPRTLSVIHPGVLQQCHEHFVCCKFHPYLVHVYSTTTTSTTTTRTTTTATTTTTTPAPALGYFGCGIRNTQGLPGFHLLRPLFPQEEALFGEFPWQAAVLEEHGHSYNFICAGALIDPKLVLTAAHCINTHHPTSFKVRLGDWDTRNETVLYPKLNIHVHKVIIHPEFNPWDLRNDLAVLVLDGYVPIAPHIAPICLPNANESFNGLRCVVTGWGMDNTDTWGRLQTILKKVDVPIVNNTLCQARLRNTSLGQPFILDERFICAGGEEGRDACRGDGGGALACEIGGVYRLAGVVSWGIGCGRRDVPGVYVRVSSYITWILSIIQDVHTAHYEMQHAHDPHTYPWR